MADSIWQDSIGDGDNHLEATLNEKGWVTESIEYENGTINNRSVYEYSPSGYTETSHCILLAITEQE